MASRLAGLAVAVFVVRGFSLVSQDYSARRAGDVVRLEDTRSQIAVSIAPGAGNVVFDMSVKGRNILQWPYGSIEEFKAKPAMNGIPFMAPWANRLDELGFYANGRRYGFDMTLGNIRGERPIHGFLAAAEWQASDLRADAASAWSTSRLEFFRNPQWMKQFPFAHTIEMTHRLRDGALQVTTRISNQSVEPMPVSVGFHPCFRVTDAPRDEWTIGIDARTRWLLASTKIPTGETEPIDRLFPDPRSVPLKDYNLDDVFSDLRRDRGQRATAFVRGRSQQIDIVVDDRYRALVVFAPAGRDFICIEPMAAITNAMNLAHRGVYKELQTLPPGQTWEASFWVKPHGF